MFGCTLGHEDAYRLARGEEIKSSTGLPVKLSRPLDWIVITDHSDMMGIATDIQRGAPNIMADPKGKEWAEGFQKGGEAAHRTELKENIYNELRGRYTIVFEQQVNISALAFIT